MKSTKWYLLGASALASCFVTALAFAQAQDLDFDPADPFANIASAQEWTGKFASGVPAIDPNDRFRNLTSREWTETGEYETAEQQGLSAEAFLASFNGSGGSGVQIRSPYPYDTAEQHYDAWLAAANGGTDHSRMSLPDWSGSWQGTSQGVLHQTALVRDVWDAIADDYRPGFQQLLTAELESRHWWPADTCLPEGFGRFYALNGAVFHFMMDPTLVLIHKDRPNNETRYIYTDGRGFLPPDFRFAAWFGHSQAFWDGDELVVWTRDIIPWVLTHGLPESSDELQAIERIKKIGDSILLDITLYDPKAFAFPWHDVAEFRRLEDWTTAPETFNECVSTNNVYHDENGNLRQYTPGNPNYRDASDSRPWATVFERGERASEAAGEESQ
nr:MAG: hypothetical protein E4H34_05865 [Hyphomicrobiales bacterium]